jgi:hypothetical protein
VRHGRQLHHNRPDKRYDSNKPWLNANDSNKPWLTARNS